MIGNDVIDMHFVDSPAYQHVRYLERVCTPMEFQVVRRSTDPAKSLAIIWASKEATYKLLSKQTINCQFVPRQFVTHFDNRDPLNFGGELAVSYAGIRYDVEITITERWVHAVATFPEKSVVRWVVREIEGCFLQGRQIRDESEAARFLAAELLSESDRAEMVLEFVGRVPTLRWKGKNPAGIGISLSHHGAFAGAAVAWPSGKTRSQ